MQTLFFGLAALITPTNINLLMAIQFLAMLPFGWITLLCYTTASLNVPQRDLGVAIGLIGTFRSLGGAVGSVIFSSIFSQTAGKQVASRVISTAVKAGVTAKGIPGLIEAVSLELVGIPGAAAMSGVSTSVFEASVTAARYGYAYGFRIAWLSSIAFGVVAVLCAACVRDPSKYFTNHVEIHLNKKIGGTYDEAVHAKEKGGEM